MKRCSTCGVEKALDDFARDARRKDGKQSRCRMCHREANRLWREKNPGYFQTWYQTNREQERAKRKAVREADLENFRRRAL